MIIILIKYFIVLCLFVEILNIMQYGIRIGNKYDYIILARDIQMSPKLYNGCIFPIRAGLIKSIKQSYGLLGSVLFPYNIFYKNKIIRVLIFSKSYFLIRKTFKILCK